MSRQASTHSAYGVSISLKIVTLWLPPAAFSLAVARTIPKTSSSSVIGVSAETSRRVGAAPIRRSDHDQNGRAKVRGGAARHRAFWIGSRAAESCTLWATVGEAARDGGSLVVKNHDWRPDHRQEIKRVTPKPGFRYYGLFAYGNDGPGLKAGVNEKGLVVVSATAPYRQRELKAIRCLFVWPTPEKASGKSASRVRISSGGEARWHRGKRSPPFPPGPTCWTSDAGGGSALSP